jgi:hypothetical protein
LNKIVVIIFFTLIILGSVYANHFTPAWWGQKPYLAMNFYISGAEVFNQPLSTGDEIGIFDGNTLVGAALLSGPISSFQLVPINVSMTGGGVPGSATPGHFITFKVWVDATQMEYSYPEMSVFFNNENATAFETQGTSFINMLSYSTPTGISTQTLTPPSGPGGGYVYNTAFTTAGIVLDQIWINTGGGGNVTAYSFNTPTLDCTFNGTPPVYNPNYGWFIDATDVSYYASMEYPITVSFYLSDLQNIGDPASLILYRRNIHGSGPFIPLTAVYNPATGYLTAQVTALGEFIIGNFTTPNMTGSLTGYIYAYGTSTPLTNVLVTAGSYTYTTGFDGYYEFPALPTGFYTVYYETAGYVRTARDASIFANTALAIDVYMVPDGLIPQYPQYLTISRVEDGFRLDWDASEIAQSYNVYVSDEPYTEYTFLVVTDLNYIILTDGFLLSKGVNPQYSFFRVMAESELP